MVENTVHRVAEKLTRLHQRRFSLRMALEVLSHRARSVEELMVIEVMREVYQELEGTSPAKARARSA